MLGLGLCYVVARQYDHHIIAAHLMHFPHAVGRGQHMAGVEQGARAEGAGVLGALGVTRGLVQGHNPGELIHPRLP